MRFIIGTRSIDNAKVYINPKKICAVYPDYRNKDETIIQFNDEESYLIVLESAETIINLILNEVNE